MAGWRGLRHILTDYAPHDIFNMDEFVLFFKLLPDRTLAFKEDASDTVDHACETLVAEVLDQQGVTEGISFIYFREDSEVQTSPDMSDESHRCLCRC
ncbi:hypothetical protein HPB49_009094 [Dermacentor silvarum]|uniref:Uncharacterized protein n=1 Tax=Dermacentor silvarum TaxID=543639 RepID=A0ACB8C2S7_DERSI|nr:hypothetical protein HPB49_009094 [Dermacentor silvarum]